MSITAKQLTGAGQSILPSFIAILKGGEKLTGVNDDNRTKVVEILTKNGLKLEAVISTAGVGKSRWDFETELKKYPQLVTAIKSYEKSVEAINGELEKIYGKGKGVRLQPYNRNLSNQKK